MNAVEAIILRKLRSGPQWATGFKNAKLVVRNMKSKQWIYTKAHASGGLQYRITLEGQRQLKLYERKKSDEKI